MHSCPHTNEIRPIRKRTDPRFLGIVLAELEGGLHIDEVEDWRTAEAAILALGAIAEGCSHEMEPHVGAILPILLSAAGREEDRMRATAFWTLSR